MINVRGIPFLVAEHETGCSRYFPAALLQRLLEKVYSNGYRDESLREAHDHRVGDAGDSDDGVEDGQPRSQFISTDAGFPLGYAWSDECLGTLRRLESIIAAPYFKDDAVQRERRKKEEEERQARLKAAEEEREARRLAAEEARRARAPKKDGRGRKKGRRSSPIVVDIAADEDITGDGVAEHRASSRRKTRPSVQRVASVSPPRRRSGGPRSTRNSLRAGVQQTDDPDRIGPVPRTLVVGRDWIALSEAPAEQPHGPSSVDTAEPPASPEAALSSVESEEGAGTPAASQPAEDSPSAVITVEDTCSSPAPVVAEPATLVTPEPQPVRRSRRRHVA